MTFIDDLTVQIDGVTDTFTLTNTFLPDTVAIGYNGQLFAPAVNILSTDVGAKTVQLSFVPSDPDTLLAIYEDTYDATADIEASSNPPPSP